MLREVFRVLGMAIRKSDGQADSHSRANEMGLTFIGFPMFFDLPKADVQQAIIDLTNRGVQLKIITGDNEKVARHVAQAVLHLQLVSILTGDALNEKPDEAAAFGLAKLMSK